MRLVIAIFDHPSAYAHRKRNGAFIDKSAIEGHDLSSLDTYTGLPFELEQEILTRFHTLDTRIRLPSDIWGDLSRPDSFPVVVQDGTQPTEQTAKKNKNLDATAAVFTPGQGAVQPVHRKKHLVHETIRPVFTPPRSLDWRFGLVQCDYLEGPIEMSSYPGIKSPVPYSKTLELPAIFETRARSITALTEEKETHRPPAGNAGTIDLGYGIVHLYKDEQDEDEEDAVVVRRPAGKAKHTAKKDGSSKEEGEGRMVAVLAVPSNWAMSDFLLFVEKAVVSIEQMRIMRDALPNRYMALIKFKTSLEANVFMKCYDSKPFSEMLLDEVCHVVKISSVEIKTSKTAPYTFAFPMQGLEFGDGSAAEKKRDKESGKLELPTCPVCLERMDSNVSGLITVQCSHTFHCMCLQGWPNNNCPVCRYSQGRSKTERTYGSSTHTACAVCSATESLWMCLICGHVGCGRFSGRHAHDHFEETGHTFAYEIESQRVWDYAGDQYVHRLIQSKTDGKLVELPSSAASAPGGHKAGPHGAASDEIAKIEAISIEFSDLLSTQLDSQRSYFAEKVGKLKEDLAAAETQREIARNETSKVCKQLEEIKKQQEASRVLREAEENMLRARVKVLEDETVPNLERDKARVDKKLEKASELARNFHKELEGERRVTKGLMENMAKLREENEKRKKETETLQSQVQDLSEQLQDLMFTLTAQARIAEAGGEGGDVVVQQGTSGNKGRRSGRGR